MKPVAVASILPFFNVASSSSLVRVKSRSSSKASDKSWSTVRLLKRARQLADTSSMSLVNLKFFGGLRSRTWIGRRLSLT